MHLSDIYQKIYQKILLSEVYTQTIIQHVHRVYMYLGHTVHNLLFLIGQKLKILSMELPVWDVDNFQKVRLYFQRRKCT